MKNKVNIYIILSIVLIAMLMFGCTRRDLEMRPDNGYLKINLHWKQSSVPGVTTYYFYNSRGGEPIVAEGTSSGFEGWLPAETYHVIISNKEMSGASYQVNGSHENDIILAGEVFHRAGPGYIGSVERVFGTGLEEIEVPRSEIPVVVDAYPQSYTRYITFILQSDALDNVSALSVDVDGIIYSVKAFSGEAASMGTAVVRAEASRKDGEKDFSTTVSVFGFIDKNEVTADVTFSGGETVTTLPSDITDDLAALPEEGGTVIVPLKFPDGGEFNLTMVVRPWSWGGSGGAVIE